MDSLERAENLQRELLAALAELPVLDDGASPGRRQQYATLGRQHALARRELRRLAKPAAASAPARRTRRPARVCPARPRRPRRAHPGRVGRPRVRRARRHPRRARGPRVRPPLPGRPRRRRMGAQVHRARAVISHVFPPRSSPSEIASRSASAQPTSSSNPAIFAVT
jgi:hypothetical protein